MSSVRVLGLFVGLLAVLSPVAASGQMKFKNVELRVTYLDAEEGDKGKLFVDADSIRFFKNNERDEYFGISSESVNGIFYSRVSGRRIKTAIFVALPLLFSKGKKHYMTLTFDDGGDVVGALEFRLDKKNYRGVLRAIEQVSGVTLTFDQEGVAAEEEGFASRGDGGDQAEHADAHLGAPATVELRSEPTGAEIEIDGTFAGMTPRTKNLAAGEHEIVISMRGFKEWKKKIIVEAGEQFPIIVQLVEDD